MFEFLLTRGIFAGVRGSNDEIFNWAQYAC